MGEREPRRGPHPAPPRARGQSAPAPGVPARPASAGKGRPLVGLGGTARGTRVPGCRRLRPRGGEDGEQEISCEEYLEAEAGETRRPV